MLEAKAFLRDTSTGSAGGFQANNKAAAKPAEAGWPQPPCHFLILASFSESLLYQFFPGPASLIPPQAPEVRKCRPFLHKPHLRLQSPYFET